MNASTNFELARYKQAISKYEESRFKPERDRELKFEEEVCGN